MVNLKKFTENKSYYNKYEKQNFNKKLMDIATINFQQKVKPNTILKILEGSTMTFKE